MYKTLLCRENPVYTSASVVIGQTNIKGKNTFAHIIRVFQNISRAVTGLAELVVADTVLKYQVVHFTRLSFRNSSITMLAVVLS